MTRPITTADQILTAAETLLISSEDVEAISVRKIAGIAGVNPSAISYHFGSREQLLLEAVRLIYRRFNSERLQLLQVAIDAKAPEPPDLTDVIAALVGPSVRWSLDPNSSYLAFVNLTALMRRSHEAQVERALNGRIGHLRPFIAAFRQIAPWLSDAAIGFRIHSALGIRSNVVRDRRRLEALVGNAYELNDADEVIELMVCVIAPMFQPSSSPGSTRSAARTRSTLRHVD